MKTRLFAFAATALAFTLSCSDGGGKGGGTAEPIRKAKISGVFQKGPFVEGTAATLNELDNDLNPTGRPYQTLITDDKGTFELKNVELVSPYAHLIASGFYRNEVTGSKSPAPITLQAVVDVTNRDNVNVNVLTHLEYYRVLDLVDGGMAVKAAKKQAQREILAVFGIDGDSFKDSEDMTVFGTSESDAALLAVSILLLGDLGEADFTQRLMNFSQAIRNGGVWDNDAEKGRMADWAAGADLAGVRSNILGWGLSAEVPEFGKYVKDYWVAIYGIGACDAGLQGIIKKSNKGVDYICKNNAWEIASEYERDVYQWSCAVSNESEIKAGNVSGILYVCKNNSWQAATDYEKDVKLVCSASNEKEVKSGTSGQYYICKGNAWQIATEYEYDTYGWGSCGEEGVLRDGLASGKKYVCEDSAWRLANAVEAGLGGCTVAIQGKVDNIGTSYYYCDSKVWRDATEHEYDTYQWNCSTEGEIKDGQISGKKYICKNGNWQTPRYIEIKCHESKSCLTFTDTRDNQTYFYVTIGEQTWMAENLNYNATGSKCYNCNTYGRLYNWAVAMSLSSNCNSGPCSSQISEKHRGICPSDWHLPSSEEWQELVDFAGGDGTAGAKLKATSGWKDHSGNGTDDYGFSALPGGYGKSDGSFDGVGYFGSWWSASEDLSDGAYGRVMGYDNEYVGYNHIVKIHLFSVRCVHD